VKEFWLEPKVSLSDDEIRDLVERTGADTVLLQPATRKQYVRVASRTPGANIYITSNLDDPIIAKNADFPVAVELTIRDRKDQLRVNEALRLNPNYLIVTCPNWKTIPLENIIAETHGKTKLIARVTEPDEARTALSNLELGVDGILVRSDKPGDFEIAREIFATHQNAKPEKVSLVPAKITGLKTLGSGSRVCVDTVELILPGEGLLTGCSSQGLFLVEAEVHTNPHVNPRPFRVNAGPVSLYNFSRDGKTRYLSELSAGETVVLVNRSGETRSVDVARVKIERRPMLLIEAGIADRAVKTIVQNAETVRLVTPDGSKSVSELKPGDEVLVRLDEGGRHFGTKVQDEMIIEK
jgi:3-dehydroquinate synthase II